MPQLIRHRLVIIDRAQLAKPRGPAFRSHRDYIAQNAEFTVLLSATPFNKEFSDVAEPASGCSLDDDDLGLRARALAAGFTAEDLAELQINPKTLRASNAALFPDDWRDLMVLFLVAVRAPSSKNTTLNAMKHATATSSPTPTGSAPISQTCPAHHKFPSTRLTSRINTRSSFKRVVDTIVRCTCHVTGWRNMSSKPAAEAAAPERSCWPTDRAGNGCSVCEDESLQGASKLRALVPPLAPASHHPQSHPAARVRHRPTPAHRHPAGDTLDATDAEMTNSRSISEYFWPAQNHRRLAARAGRSTSSSNDAAREISLGCALPVHADLAIKRAPMRKPCASSSSRPARGCQPRCEAQAPPSAYYPEAQNGKAPNFRSLHDTVRISKGKLRPTASPSCAPLPGTIRSHSRGLGVQPRSMRRNIPQPTSARTARHRRMSEDRIYSGRCYCGEFRSAVGHIRLIQRAGRVDRIGQEKPSRHLLHLSSGRWRGKHHPPSQTGSVVGSSK